MAREITKASWSLNFNGRDEDYNDIRSVDVRFENPEDDAEVVEQLNTFLRAVGVTNVACRTLN